MRIVPAHGERPTFGQLASIDFYISLGTVQIRTARAFFIYMLFKRRVFFSNYNWFIEDIKIS